MKTPAGACAPLTSELGTSEYAESFRRRDRLQTIQQEARTIVATVLAGAMR